MNRFIFSFTAIAFGFALVVVSALAIGKKDIAGEVLAQNAVASPSALIEASESADISISEVILPTIDYYLPYPGILPDHVLYPLKMLRDRLRLLTTNNPRGKAELTLLYADKRIGAAQVLTQGGKQDLGVDTAVKAEGYLSQAVTEAAKVQDQLLWQQLELASMKHGQILASLKDLVSVDNLSRIENIIETNEQLQQAIASNLEQPEQEISEEASDVEVEEINPAEFGR